MKRTLTSHLDLDSAGAVTLTFSVAVAAGLPLAEEELIVTAGGEPAAVTEILDDHGTRLHRVTAGQGPVVLDYRAVVMGTAEPAVVEPRDEVRYLRPSRYCESDSLAPTAASVFGDLTGFALLDAVSDWVRNSLDYVGGSSLPTDGAVRTLLSRTGVCRDFAHLVTAMLRARNVPARLVAGYAPGLSPMEYHAVAEALVDGSWWVVDATGLAPRTSFVRIATGRDAADTAFLTSHGAAVELVGLEVTATASDFAVDDQRTPVQLG